jgi:hypothetical protein
MKEITIEELMALSKRKFIERVLTYSKESGDCIKIDDPLTCPLHQWVVYNNAKCSKGLVPNTAVCPICGNPCCPDCHDHEVEIISRVTGYLGTVSSWNAAKKQEFKDRQRYNGGGNS